MNKTIMCGVPQGSVLGPTIFLLYVNDIQNVTNFEVRLFADDTLLYLSDKDSQTLEKNVNAELSKVQQWLDVNKLSLNISKTKYMIISPHFTEKHIYQIKLKENLLTNRKSQIFRCNHRQKFIMETSYNDYYFKTFKIVRTII